MSWITAIIGASIGGMVGGPIGAAIGAGLGGMVGNAGGNTRQQVSKRIQQAGQQNQAIFFTCLFSMLSKMAKADGVVRQQEINETKKFMREINLDEEDRNTAIKIFNNAKSDNYSIYDYAAQYADLADMPMRVLLYEVLWKLALADGSIHQEEENILRDIPQHLKINPHYFDRIHAAVHGNAGGGMGGNDAPNMDEQYALLGISPQESDAKVKQAYRRAIAEYHPDKIQSKGLPAEFMKFATEQAKKINEAYRLISEEREREEKRKTKH